MTATLIARLNMAPRARSKRNFVCGSAANGISGIVIIAMVKNSILAMSISIPARTSRMNMMTRQRMVNSPEIGDQIENASCAAPYPVVNIVTAFAMSEPEPIPSL